MDTIPHLDLEEFQKALTPQRMRAFQIVMIALLAASTVFLGIVLVMYSRTEPAEEVAENSMLGLLSIVHVCVALIEYSIIYFISRFLISRQRLQTSIKESELDDSGTALSLEDRCVNVLFTISIIRTAAMEGVALFGLVVCLLGVMEGEIHTQPVYWCNLFSYVVFAAVMLWTFPTKGRLENIFRERFMQSEFGILK